MSTHLLIILALLVLSMGSLVLVSTRDYSYQRKWGLFWCAVGVICWIALVLYASWQCLLWALSKWSM